MNKEEHKKEMNFMRESVFFIKKTKFHVSMEGKFYNGVIDEKPEDDFFFLEDQKVGRVLVFYVELTKPLEEFKEVEVDEH